MRSLFMLLLGLAMALVANAGTSSETSCFTSGSTHPIRLELRLYHDSMRNWSTGFVKYEKSTRKIPLVAADRGKTADPDRASAWIEITNNAASGEYILSRDGAGLGVSSYLLSYRNFAKNKVQSFELDVAAGFADAGCQWGKRE